MSNPTTHVLLASVALVAVLGLHGVLVHAVVSDPASSTGASVVEDQVILGVHLDTEPGDRIIVHWTPGLGLPENITTFDLVVAPGGGGDILAQGETPDVYQHHRDLAVASSSAPGEPSTRCEPGWPRPARDADLVFIHPRSERTTAPAGGSASGLGPGLDLVWVFPLGGNRTSGGHDSIALQVEQATLLDACGASITVVDDRVVSVEPVFYGLEVLAALWTTWAAARWVQARPRASGPVDPARDHPPGATTRLLFRSGAALLCLGGLAWVLLYVQALLPSIRGAVQHVWLIRALVAGVIAGTAVPILAWVVEGWALLSGKDGRSTQEPRGDHR